jgi:hypothetical protein
MHNYNNLQIVFLLTNYSVGNLILIVKLLKSNYHIHINFFMLRNVSRIQIYFQNIHDKIFAPPGQSKELHNAQFSFNLVH